MVNTKELWGKLNVSLLMLPEGKDKIKDNSKYFEINETYNENKTECDISICVNGGILILSCHVQFEEKDKDNAVRDSYEILFTSFINIALNGLPSKMDGKYAATIPMHRAIGFNENPMVGLDTSIIVDGKEIHLTKKPREKRTYQYETVQKVALQVFPLLTPEVAVRKLLEVNEAINTEFVELNDAITPHMNFGHTDINAPKPITEYEPTNNANVNSLPPYLDYVGKSLDKLQEVFDEVFALSRDLKIYIMWKSDMGSSDTVYNFSVYISSTVVDSLNTAQEPILSGITVEQLRDSFAVIRGVLLSMKEALNYVK